MTEQPGSRAPDLAGVDRARVHAESLNSLGRHQQALASASRGLASAPDDVELLVQAAVAQLGLERPAEAGRLLRAAGATDPDSARVQRLVAFAAVREGDLGTALRAARRAVLLAPHDPYAHAQLARVYAATGQRRPAVTSAEEALALAPDLADAHVSLADALFPEGSRPPRADLRRAEGHLLRALQIEPGNASALNDVARVQLALGRRVAAAGHLASAVRADPMAVVAQRNMDIVLVGLVARAHYVVFVMVLLTHNVLPTFGITQRPASAVVAALGVAALVWVAVRLRRQVPSHLGAFLRQFARRERLATAWAACLALATALLVVRAAGPESWATNVLGAAIVAMLVGVILSWIRYRQDRRGAKRGGLA